MRIEVAPASLPAPGPRTSGKPDYRNQTGEERVGVQALAATAGRDGRRITPRSPIAPAGVNLAGSGRDFYTCLTSRLRLILCGPRFATSVRSRMSPQSTS